MKSVLISGALTVFLSLSATAQGSIFVPTPDPSRGSPSTWPFDDGPSWRYLFILNGSSLGHTRFKVADLAFAAAETKAFTAARFQVRMAHTTLTRTNTRFDEVLGPCPIVVYDGKLDWPAVKDQWVSFGLERSFGYDGVSNLVIELRFRGGSGGFGQGPRIHIDEGGASLMVNAGMHHDPYIAETGNTVRGRPRVRLTWTDAHQLAVTERVAAGGSGQIQMDGAQAGDGYQIAASLGQSGLPVGRFEIGLDPDALLFASVVVGAPIFNGYAGLVRGDGRAAASIMIPNAVELIGVSLFHAGVTYNGTGGIRGATNTCGTTITP